MVVAVIDAPTAARVVPIQEAAMPKTKMKRMTGRAPEET